MQKNIKYGIVKIRRCKIVTDPIKKVRNPKTCKHPHIEGSGWDEITQSTKQAKPRKPTKPTENGYN